MDKSPLSRLQNINLTLLKMKEKRPDSTNLYKNRLKENKSDFNRKTEDFDKENRFNYNNCPIINKKQNNLKIKRKDNELIFSSDFYQKYSNEPLSAGLKDNYKDKSSKNNRRSYIWSSERSSMNKNQIKESSISKSYNHGICLRNNKNTLNSEIPEFTLGQMNFPCEKNKPVKVQPNFGRYNTLNPDDIGINPKKNESEKLKKLFYTAQEDSFEEFKEVYIRNKTKPEASFEAIKMTNNKFEDTPNFKKNSSSKRYRKKFLDKDDISKNYKNEFSRISLTKEYNKVLP
mmetsp:Transcript_7080/g.6278  ORF Transcript_7080/g.6278 Transcript_7080/m.6278 type:complete len:288 (+) Transcript_7080:156-1019(+)